MRTKQVHISTVILLLALFLAFSSKMRRLLVLSLRVVAAFVALKIPTAFADGALRSLEKRLEKLHAKRRGGSGAVNDNQANEVEA